MNKAETQTSDPVFSGAFDSYEYVNSENVTVQLPKGTRFRIRTSMESATVLIVVLRIGSIFSGRWCKTGFVVKPGQIAEQIESAKRELIAQNNQLIAIGEELAEISRKG